jgi:hypothetical protein
MKLKFFFLSSALVAATLPSFGWGQKGHDLTAHIAERHLTPATQRAVDEILDGQSMVYFANWPDNACHTPEYDYTKTWHYKNIDPEQTYETAPLNEDGDIVTALNEQYAVLTNPESTKDQKWLALVLTVHFLGDIHQPLHMGRANDRGGNSHKIKYFNGDTNLHSTWDSKLVESAHKWSYTEWADNIDRVSPQTEAEILNGGSPREWGKETYEISKKVYDSTPEGTNVSYDYIAEWSPVIERQLLSAGLRLADLLNGIFDPTYAPRHGEIK